MPLRPLLFAAAILATAGATSEANAYFTFGFSGGSAGQLTLNFSGGGSTTIDTGFDQGWWSPNAFNYNSNTNYITGNEGDIWNDYFVFDLTGQSGTVTSATLTLNSETISGGPLTYTLWDVTTPIADLENKDNNPNAAIYADLGSGVQYGGGFPLNDANSGQNLDFALNANGVAAINSALGGLFAIGGTVNQVPEPSSMVVLGAALTGFGLYRRRRSNG